MVFRGQKKTDAKAQEALVVFQEWRLLPRSSLLILANAGPTSCISKKYFLGYFPISVRDLAHSTQDYCPFLFTPDRSNVSGLFLRQEYFLPGIPLVLVIKH